MRTTPVLVGLAGIVFAAAAAHAQGLTQAWTQASPMTPQDRAIILSTADAQIHGRPPGTVAKWSNPDGGHSGTITLLSKSTRKGMPCERIEYKILEPARHGSTAAMCSPAARSRTAVGNSLIRSRVQAQHRLERFARDEVHGIR